MFGRGFESLRLHNKKDILHRMSFLLIEDENLIREVKLSLCRYVYENCLSYRDELIEFYSNKHNSDQDTLIAILSWGGMHREHGKKTI